MFERWGHLVYRFRWPTIALAVAALSLSIFGLIAGANETGVQSSGTLESDRASNLIKAELPKVAGQGSSILLLFSDSRLSVSDPAFREALTSAVAPLHSDPTVTAVRTPYDSGGQGLISRDQHQAIVVVELKDTRAVAEKSVSRTVSRIVYEVHPGRLRLVATGDLPISAAFSSTLAADLNHAELVALPLALLLLVLIFRSAIAACIPVAIGGLTIIGGVALTLLLSRFTFVTQYAYNIVTWLAWGFPSTTR